MPYPTFDRSRLELKPLAERVSDMTLADLKRPGDPLPEFANPKIGVLAGRIRVARERGAAVILSMGAHVIKSGLTPYLIALMEGGFVTHFALNGACAIHDFELALHGGTTESVARYISEGQFGLWQETGMLNEAAKEGAANGMGFGEGAGRYIAEHGFPHSDVSLLAAGYRLRVPVTVHIGIGCDIVHEHPNCDGAALGQTSYTDFLIYAQTITNLENGVFLNFGSAVTGPEVYLKCLAMARNLARKEGRSIANFTTANFDLHDYEDYDTSHEPSKSDAQYYYRPWKTILSRTVADGGESFYIKGFHHETLPRLTEMMIGGIPLSPAGDIPL